ncbi:MAG: winged helix DNA-binding domain-containing protein [Archangium sp.]|nr:winged helix DNA-binding domain-containing protein [Archangium sp.]
MSRASRAPSPRGGRRTRASRGKEGRGEGKLSLTQRLQNQALLQSRFKEARAVVSWLGGLQGQDPESAKWSIGLRLPGSTKADVEAAFTRGELVRTWPMRGTLFVVAAEDARWLLALTAPGNLKRAAYRRTQLELDDKTLSKSRKVLIKTLTGGHRTREELATALEQAKISTEGQRAYHLLWDAAVNGLLCYAEMRGKQHTFALVDEWLPATKEKPRDEALAELAKRYFQSRSPATLKDFTWWSGLTAREARQGYESMPPSGKGLAVHPERSRGTSIRSALALSGFDEYVLGYADRDAVLDPRFADRICPGGNGVFAPTLVLDGRVVGTWKRATGELEFFKPVKPAERRALEQAVERYAAF